MNFIWDVLDDILCFASFMGYKPEWYLSWYQRDESGK